VEHGENKVRDWICLVGVHYY